MNKHFQQATIFLVLGACLLIGNLKGYAQNPDKAPPVPDAAEI